MEKTVTCISLEDLKVEDFNYDTKRPVRMYALLLTHRKSQKTNYVTQFLVTDLSFNDTCAYPIQYFDLGFQFKEDVFVEPEQKFSVDLFDKKLEKLNEALNNQFQYRIPNAGNEFSTDLFNRKFLVEISATVKRYKNQLDINKAQMFPLTKDLLIRRAVTERDSSLIKFLNRLKTKISGEWLKSLDTMYGFSDIMRRLNGIGFQRDNDSDILESQAPNPKRRKPITNPQHDISDPSRRLIADILPSIKQELAASPSDHEEVEKASEEAIKDDIKPSLSTMIDNENENDSDNGNDNEKDKDDYISNGIGKTQVGNSDDTVPDSSESRIIETSSHLLGLTSNSQIIAHSTQQSQDLPPQITVDIVGMYPSDELLEVRNIYTNEIEYNDSIEVYVKFKRETVKRDMDYKSFGIIKFKSAQDFGKFFGSIDRRSIEKPHHNEKTFNFHGKQLTIPLNDWLTLFQKTSEQYFVFWSSDWKSN